MKQRQVNVRLDATAVEVLEAAAFADARTLADEAREALLAHVEKIRDDPLIVRALDVRAQRASETPKPEKTVSSLDAKRKRARGRDV